MNDVFPNIEGVGIHCKYKQVSLLRRLVVGMAVGAGEVEDLRPRNKAVFQLGIKLLSISGSTHCLKA